MVIETFRGVVYPAQCDAMGHLNTSEYVKFFDAAEWHCMAALGYDARLIHEQRIGMADARHVIEYRKELLAGDLVRGESEVLRVGTTSLTTFHRLFNAASGELCATLECVTVMYDLDRRRPVPLVDALRRGAEAALTAKGT
jgi:acyl-CoA thioester hydrolase